MYRFTHLLKLQVATLFFLLLLSPFVRAADTTRVLFIGNSYTYLNQMPDIIKNMAAATGDVLIYQSSTQGGATLQQHCQNAATLGLIAQGNWDYVVLQEQSQLPSFPMQQVATECLPFAHQLDSLIHVATPCAKTIFFRTWGRKNGDQTNCASFPPICTYDGMDSLLDLRYTMMADSNQAHIAPVGTVWHYIRDHYPQITLYQSDESHPTLSGSFLAACTFYTSFFQKDPALAPYNYVLPASEAAIIKQATKEIVFDSLTYWQRFNPLPVASFSYTRDNDSTFTFWADSSTNIIGYKWDFGDGSPNSFSPTVTKTYTGEDSVTVCLTVYGDCDTATSCITIEIGATGISNTPVSGQLKIYPNPITSNLYIEGEKTTFTGTIASMDGRIVQTIEVKTPTRINLENLPSGMYLLTLQNEHGHISHHKFVKR